MSEKKDLLIVYSNFSFLIAIISFLIAFYFLLTMLNVDNISFLTLDVCCTIIGSTFILTGFYSRVKALEIELIK